SGARVLEPPQRLVFRDAVGVVLTAVVNERLNRRFAHVVFDVLEVRVTLPVPVRAGSTVIPGPVRLIDRHGVVITRGRHGLRGGRAVEANSPLRLTRADVKMRVERLRGLSREQRRTGEIR